MGLNEFVGLLVTMYRCISAVMTICIRVAWVLVTFFLILLQYDICKVDFALRVTLTRHIKTD